MSEHYALFDTAIGRCGIAWSPQGLTRLQLPEADPAATEARLAQISRGRAATPPTALEPAIASVQRYCEGERVDFSPIALDFAASPAFHRRVYEAARAIAWGETVTYGELARRVGSPGAARAVGQALGRNPVAIIVPCHRVLAGGRKLGGFSAHGGVSLKVRLLTLEGVRLDPTPAPPPHPVLALDGLDTSPAVRALSADEALSRIIREAGPCTLEPKQDGTPFSLLAEAVVHQQLSTAAGRTITRRLVELLGGTLAPEPLLRQSWESLRGVGLSNAKCTTILALAHKTLDGTIPDFTALHAMDDEEIIRRLTSVKGVGLWTAQMFLIFALARPDVMPAQDLGIRRGFQVALQLPELPSPAAILQYSERWRPHRTVASWYLWRAADAAWR